jgi:hypothetical protein
VVGFTIVSRGKVSGKTCEKIAMMTTTIIIINLTVMLIMRKIINKNSTAYEIFNFSVQNCVIKTDKLMQNVTFTKCVTLKPELSRVCPSVRLFNLRTHSVNLLLKTVLVIYGGLLGWLSTQCKHVGGYQRFGGAYCLHLQNVTTDPTGPLGVTTQKTMEPTSPHPMTSSNLIW